MQRLLRELQEREKNSQRQLMEFQQGGEYSQRQLTEFQQREENSQRQLREFQQHEENSQRQLTELHRQLREIGQQLTNCRGQVSELQLSLSTAQQTINQLRNQETRDWAIPRDEIQITEKYLGRGGWGIVNEGTYCGCTVAVKQIHQLIISPHNINLFEREMNIASKCRHPHLLQFIGATNDEGTLLFVTELMEKSLRTLLEQRQLSGTETHFRTVGVQIKDLTTVLQTLLTGPNLVGFLLTEAGLAQSVEQLTEERKVAGSIPGAGPLLRVDVYSFGALLCEMCIRQLPDPRRRKEQVVLVTNGVFRGLVRRCLQREPEARPTMQEIIDELKDFDPTS
ncbi:unnamed protein product [Porites evermanni]|uniref:Protein kinase domain-containing protein n=1 Tax=Porites evermanni TaxID=104178 RepID=A0ABN8M6I9_9CNID|nr:unnamed protein product [Porites evermanni]